MVNRGTFARLAEAVRKEFPGTHVNSNAQTITVTDRETGKISVIRIQPR